DSQFFFIERIPDIANGIQGGEFVVVDEHRAVPVESEFQIDEVFHFYVESTRIVELDKEVASGLQVDGDGHDNLGRCFLELGKIQGEFRHRSAGSRGSKFRSSRDGPFGRWPCSRGKRNADRYE